MQHKKQQTFCKLLHRAVVFNNYPQNEELRICTFPAMCVSTCIFSFSKRAKEYTGSVKKK